MPFFSNRSYFLYGVFLIFSLSVAGCGQVFKGHRTGGQTVLPHLERIAVLPLDRARTRPGQEKATCALTDSVFDVSEVPPEASSTLSQVLRRELSKDPRFFIVPEGQCIGFLSSLLESDVKASQVRLIREFGKELNADAVLYGIIYRFEERTGKDYAVQKPASVAFALALIRVSDGAVLWHYNFDETQKPLTEDLFKIGLFKETGMKWVSAERLGEIGLKRALTNLLKQLR